MAGQLAETALSHFLGIFDKTRPVDDEYKLAEAQLFQALEPYKEDLLNLRDVRLDDWIGLSQQHEIFTIQIATITANHATISVDTFMPDPYTNDDFLQRQELVRLPGRMKLIEMEINPEKQEIINQSVYATSPISSEVGLIRAPSNNNYDVDPNTFPPLYLPDLYLIGNKHEAIITLTKTADLIAALQNHI